MNEPRGIRPSVLAIAGLMVAACAFAIYQASSFDPLAPEEGASEERRDRTRRDRARERSDRRLQRADRSSAGRGGGYVRHDWGRESDLNRRMSLHLPGPSFWRDAASGGVPGNDPQLGAMWRSFHSMSGPDGEAPELPFEPMAHRAELLESEGDVNASPTSCDVRVLPVQSGSFNCVVRVMCDGRVLYPNPSQTAGYVGCEVDDEGRPIRAVDSGNSRSDGDPLVSLDLENGTVTVEDFDSSGERRYRATLRING